MQHGMRSPRQQCGRGRSPWAFILKPSFPAPAVLRKAQPKDIRLESDFNQCVLRLRYRVNEVEIHSALKEW